VVSAIDFYSAFDSFRFIYYLFDLFALQPRRRNLFWPAPVSAGQVNHSYATDTRMSSAHFVLFALLRLAAIQFNSAWFGYENTFHFDFVAIEMEMLHSVEEKPGGRGKIAWAVASRVRITYTQHLPPKSVGAKIASVKFQVLQLAFLWVS